MQFKNKTIYIISREQWGNMLMSKQHYAIELGRMGNKVYFINHPDLQHKLKRGEVKISETGFDNVVAVSHRLVHPYFLKFKLNGLYNFLTSLHIKKLVRKIGMKPDISWLFDIGNSLPLKYFPECEAKIYMPVDGPDGTKEERKAPMNADIIISVTEEILANYKETNLPKYCINHGVAELFVNENVSTGIHSPICAGYSGSLLRNDLDHVFFLACIKSNPDVQFEFWGEYDFLNSNIHQVQDISEAVKTFIDELKKQRNVILHGAVNPNVLADGLKRMDVLLLAYTIKNAQNSHKLLEYLATGKVIVSSYMSSYFDKRGELIEMVSNKESNEELSGLFNIVVNDLEKYNSLYNQKLRINFARQFSYPSQIKKIEKFLESK